LFVSSLDPVGALPDFFKYGALFADEIFFDRGRRFLPASTLRPLKIAA